MCASFSEPILQVKGLETHFRTEEGLVKAVDGLDFTLHKKETLAIVGESGCGKSVASLSILRLIPNPPGKIVGGEIIYNDQPLLELTEKQMRQIRGNEISMIFQEPMTSLNPVLTVGYQISEVLKIHQNMNNKEARQRSCEMLQLVGIPNPDKCVENYPHQLSGGMRQRVMIAIALACNPKILIADEPTTALDVTIQSQILGLILQLKEKMDTAIILITHDLGVVAQLAENIMVMYCGKAVEYSDAISLFRDPLHPYTKGLLNSIPRIDAEDYEPLSIIRGVVPSPLDLPEGCKFCTRCDEVMDKCYDQEPDLYDMGNGRKVKCWKYANGGE